MDLDGDGHLDIISGSWPGEIFFFKGAADLSFSAPVKLKGNDGRAINLGGGLQRDNTGTILVAGDASYEKTNDGGTVIVYDGERIVVPEGKQAGITGTASAVHTVDFTGDGLLDLLVGNISGDVFLVANEGTAAVPAWAEERQLTAGEHPLHVEGDAGPFACDWDDDGALDLLVGDGDGAVWFFRNTGSAAAPTFAAGIELIPSARASYERPENPTEPHRGIRAKVCAVDFDGDGRLDLLVGDFSTQKAVRPEPTAAERIEQDKARAETESVLKHYRDVHRRLYVTKVRDKAERTDLERELKDLLERFRELYDKVPQDYEEHGWVWLYKRKSR